MREVSGSVKIRTGKVALDASSVSRVTSLGIHLARNGKVDNT